MQSRTQQPTSLASALGALALGLAAIAVVSACHDDDRLPTAPTVTTPGAPQAAIVGANVISLPFSPVAINEAGQVAGTQSGPGAGETRAVRWSPAGGVQDLGTLGGSASVGYAINEAGQVVGSSYTSGNTATHAFLWTPGRGMQDLGTLGGSTSTAHGINDAGSGVGDSYLVSGGRHAFLWTPSDGMRDLGALEGAADLSQSIAYDINNVGQVVGESFHPLAREAPRAFLWTADHGIQNLGGLGQPTGIAYAINDAGQVVGQSWTSRGPYHAFLWTSAQGMRDLGTYMTLNSAAYGINEAGQVVGIGDIGPGLLQSAAFLWSAAEGMEGIWPTTGIGFPRDINDHLQVVGSGRVATLQLQPGSRAPVASVGGPYTGVEGSPVKLALSTSDPDGDAVFSMWDFGDGITGWTDGSFSATLSHTYQDDGTYTVTLTVRDTKGNTDTKTTTATIANVAPTIPTAGLTGPLAPIQLVGGSADAAIRIAFSDPAGERDTYGAEIQCGNGTTLSPNDITSLYIGTCTYTSAGLYTVRATVSDEDGGASAPALYRYVIAYDPDGPSVTGSGFYDFAGQGNRKAHFTFSAEFVPGQTSAPVGTVKFWIPGRELDLESTGIEMLVASGSRAQFWGTGTLNGEPARFRITAVDGQVAGGVDAVRVELWNASGALIYDSQPGAAQDAAVTQPIEGGSIRIHRH